MYIPSFRQYVITRKGEKWGSRFPYLMNNLYQGELSYNDVDRAKAELTIEIVKAFQESKEEKQNTILESL